MGAIILHSVSLSLPSPSSLSLDIYRILSFSLPLSLPSPTPRSISLLLLSLSLPPIPLPRSYSCSFCPLPLLHPQYFASLLGNTPSPFRTLFCRSLSPKPLSLLNILHYMSSKHQSFMLMSWLVGHRRTTLAQAAPTPHRPSQPTSLTRTRAAPWCDY